MFRITCFRERRSVMARQVALRRRQDSEMQRLVELGATNPPRPTPLNSNSQLQQPLLISDDEESPNGTVSSSTGKGASPVTLLLSSLILSGRVILILHVNRCYTLAALFPSPPPLANFTCKFV